MKLKNLFSVLVAVAILCVGAISFAAPSQLSLSRAAIEAAKVEVPAGLNMLGYKVDRDGQESTITFQDPNTLEYYFVEVELATSKVESVKVNGATFVKGSTIINKSHEDIEKLVLAAYPNARNIVVKLEKEGNNSYYEADFVTDKFEGEVKFNPATGVIFERELDYH